MLVQGVFHGFKSFADREVIDFSNGITSIMGPNGSGKSNIFDGIRWVLGETSAKSLRGGKMQDVIFSGCDTRKPRDFAEVTLVFSNENSTFSNFDTSQNISVTRRMNKSGKSEYFINEETALLRDVQNLFMDTGIGSNSYSMIGQEQTKKLLSNNVEERRAIFEEAAGIVKMKKRKNDTEKNLKEINNDVQRLQDITTEIKKQLTPLREQSKKAAKHKELSDELRNVEIQYLLNQYDEVGEELTSVTKHLSDSKTKYSSINSQIHSSDERLLHLKKDIKTHNDLFFSLQDNHSTNKESLEKIRGEINLYTERRDTAIRNIDENNNTLKEIEENYSLSADGIVKKKGRMQDVEHQITQNKNKNSEINSILSDGESEILFLKSEIEHTRTDSINHYNNLTQGKYELEQLVKKEEELISRLANERERISNGASDKQSKESAIKEIRSLISDSENEHKKKLDDYQSNIGSAKDLEYEVNELSSEIQTLETEYVKIKSRLENLQDFITNNQGFYDGVKSILAQKGKNEFEGVIGVLAELIQVEPHYEKAVESLLQSAMQFVVVDNDSTARTCVEFLKNSKMGRATFLPLNLANPLHLNEKEEKILDKENGVNPATKFINFHDDVAPVIHSLLGRTLISEDLETGINLTKKNKIRMKIATVEGELIQTGSITGGRSKYNKRNFFTIRRELEELESAAEMKKELIKRKKVMLEEKQNRLIELNNITHELSAIIEDQKEQLREKKLQLANYEQTYSDMKERLEVISMQEQEMSLSLKETRNKKSRVSLTLKSNGDKHKELSSKLERLAESLKDKEEQLEVQKELKNSLMLENTSLQEEFKQLQEYMQSYSNDNGNLEEKIANLYSKQEGEKIKVKQIDKSLNELNEEYINLEVKTNNQQIEIDDLKEKIGNLTASIEHEEDELRNLHIIKEGIQGEINNREVKFSKLDTQFKTINSQLLNSYGISSEINSIERKRIDKGKSSEKIGTIKKSLSALGSINHNAVEECKELEKRYELESEHLQDVVQAQKDLLELIEHVEREMIEKFNETFNNISTMFKKSFVDLFGGGKAQLSLLEPEKPLESPISIMAKPPGKKPKSIDILSGGEKSLTAVALIFAIISSKSSPFIYLDEVDAPLDEANVARFAHYLKKFSEKSQFIVVSHRKGTWMVSDTVYGVTQETEGVTIMFPHKLQEEKSGT